MLKEKTLKYLPRVVFILFFVACSFFFSYSSPEKLIELIGVDNGYIAIFFLSFLGGLSTFSGVPYHFVLIAFAAGGLDPLFLGLATAIGVMLGDSTSYFVGYHGQAIIPRALQKFIEHLNKIFNRYPRLLPLFFFLYASLLPFSNDFVIIPMGFARYPFWRVIMPLALGNLIFNIALAFLAFHGYGWLQNLAG